MKQQPRIEYISPNQQYTANNTSSEQRKSPRLTIFVATFLSILIIGLIINYSRPAVYQSSATLLTSAATAIDQISRDVDFQHVTIQKQKLLGFELLTETLKRIQAEDNQAQLGLTDIRNMLTVEAIEGTNLLSMTALGDSPEILPVVINTWIDVYLDARALSVKNSTNDTVEIVKNELIELEAKIEQTRTELGLFRKEHDISSITREENESPAALKSLTAALNKAVEEEIKTKARLDAIKLDISRGKAVVPKSEQQSFQSLEKEYRQLSKKLADFDKQFTRDYLKFKPKLKRIPEQLKILEARIQAKKASGKSIVLTDARRDYYAAKQVIVETRKKLDEQKKRAIKFTTLFSKHQKYMDDLDSMEKIERETRDRLVKIESKQFEKYPQVDVVERAGINSQAISPDYNMGVLIVFITALVIAFFIVWLVEFLMRGQPEASQQNSGFPVFAWFKQEQAYESISEQQASPVIEQQDSNSLTHTPTNGQKVSEKDLIQLLNNADNNAQQLILLLLSGLSLKEISELEPEQVNTTLSVIQIAGQSARLIPFGQRVKEKLIESLKTGFLWGQQQTMTEEELNAVLFYSLADTEQNNQDGQFAEKLTQTYIIYLVEQGIRVALLSKVVGYQSPLELAAYAEFSPVGEGLELDQIDLVHPLCK